MKSLFFILSICLVTYGNGADAQIMYDINGMPFREVSYTDVQGDSYLINDWTSGSVILENNKSVAVALKYDIYTNLLLFQGKDGETMELKNKLTGFTLNNANSEVSDINPLVFVNGYPATGARTENSWYQVIADGKVKLLKYYRKIIKEERPYAVETITKSFISSKIYYVFRNNQLTEINLSKKSLIKLLDDHSAQVESYLKTNNINLKSDTDVRKLFTWYNSLN